jgi:hypothetical protein
VKVAISILIGAKLHAEPRINPASNSISQE